MLSRKHNERKTADRLSVETTRIPATENGEQVIMDKCSLGKTGQVPKEIPATGTSNEIIKKSMEGNTNKVKQTPVNKQKVEGKTKEPESPGYDQISGTKINYEDARNHNAAPLKKKGKSSAPLDTQKTPNTSNGSWFNNLLATGAENMWDFTEKSKLSAGQIPYAKEEHPQ